MLFIDIIRLGDDQSGGPVFYVDSAGNETIAAVTSSGDAQCVATGLNYRKDVLVDLLAVP